MKIPQALVQIVSVDRVQDLLIIDFSDGTMMTVTAAELILLRPSRAGVLKREPEEI